MKQNSKNRFIKQSIYEPNYIPFSFAHFRRVARGLILTGSFTKVCPRIHERENKCKYS